jgi:peptidoglycan hydrolase CwlO-like protein
MVAGNLPAPKVMAASLEGTLASLAENLSVLQILDRGAAGWPGVSASMEAMRAATRAAAALLLQQADRVQHADQEGAKAQVELERARSRIIALIGEAQQAQQSADSRATEISKVKGQLSATESNVTRLQEDLEQQVSACASASCSSNARICTALLAHALTPLPDCMRAQHTATQAQSAAGRRAGG